jgi:hypothetical protein
LLALVLTLAALVTGACRRDINLLGPRLDAGGGNDTGIATDTGAGADSVVNPACSGLGNPITLPTAALPTCAAALETRAHRYVLCSCDSMIAAARVRSDAYDSRDPTVYDEVAAAFGINGDLTANAEMRAGGAFHVAGSGGIHAATQFRSTGSLRVGGPFIGSSENADIGADAFVDGNVSGRLRVTGALHVPSGATLDPQVEYSTLVNGPVIVTPPCDCDAGFVDVALAISAAAASNANAAIGLAPTALSAAPTAPRIDLPCGTFFLDGIDTGAVTIAVHGHALLAIGGNVTTRANFVVQLDAGAELDMLLGGQLTVSGGGTFGAAGAAARFRIWAAGTAPLNLDSAPAVSAVIHAPLAPVSAPAGLPLSGSILARSIAIGADSTVHFDRAILEAGAVCGEPAAGIVP